jgi:hypothetical protein
LQRQGLGFVRSAEEKIKTSNGVWKGRGGRCWNFLWLRPKSDQKWNHLTFFDFGTWQIFYKKMKPFYKNYRFLVKLRKFRDWITFSKYLKTLKIWLNFSGAWYMISPAPIGGGFSRNMGFFVRSFHLLIRLDYNWYGLINRPI